MKKLFLDDIRTPPDSSWDVVKSYDEFVAYIEKNGVPDIISFDHDLADEHYPWGDQRTNYQPIPYDQFKEKTGYSCAQWLIERGTLPANYNVHSANPVGAQNIRFIMNAAYKRLETEDPVNNIIWKNISI